MSSEQKTASDSGYVASLAAKVDHHESGVPIWVSEQFVQLDSNENVVPNIVKRKVENVPGAFVLENFLTDDECRRLIEATSAMGYKLAKVSTSAGMKTMTDIRNNSRVIWHTRKSHSGVLFDRLQPFLDDSDEDRIGVPYALNERLRFFHYVAGQQFKPHFDGGFGRSRSDQSWMTFIVYLQSPTEGGYTKFYGDQRYGRRRTSGETTASVAPTAGTALLFYHDRHPLSPLHEGAVVEAGDKYAMRSDVMYRMAAPDA